MGCLLNKIPSDRSDVANDLHSKVSQCVDGTQVNGKQTLDGVDATHNLWTDRSLNSRDKRVQGAKRMGERLKTTTKRNKKKSCSAFSAYFNCSLYLFVPHFRVFFIALQVCLVSDIVPFLSSCRDDGGQRHHVPEAEVKALPRERMDGVSGVSDQRCPIPDVLCLHNDR